MYVRAGSIALSLAPPLARIRLLFAVVYMQPYGETCTLRVSAGSCLNCASFACYIL